MTRYVGGTGMLALAAVLVLLLRGCRNRSFEQFGVGEDLAAGDPDDDVWAKLDLSPWDNILRDIERLERNGWQP